MFQSVFDKPKSQTVFKLHSFRKHGTAKLSKPKELKGCKQVLSIPFIKCKCQVFIVGDDVWIKHNDYFSPSLSLGYEFDTMPLSSKINALGISDKKGKFAYRDDWGDIVLKQEAYIVLEKLMLDIRNKVFPPHIVNSITRQQEIHHGFDELELAVGEWERFYENLIRELKIRYFYISQVC